MLLPHVRMASIVRSLIALAETLRSTLQQIDEDTGEVSAFVLDLKNSQNIFMLFIWGAGACGHPQHRALLEGDWTDPLGVPHGRGQDAVWAAAEPADRAFLVFPRTAGAAAPWVKFVK